MPRVDFAFRCAATNTTPIGAYRGAGRPEAAALVERAMDMLAASRDGPRRPAPAQLHPARRLPAPDGDRARDYDSGEYAQALDQVLAAAGYEDLRAEQAARRERGDVRALGIGMATYVELTGFGSEMGACTVAEDGSVTVVTRHLAARPGPRDDVVPARRRARSASRMERRAGRALRHRHGPARRGDDGLAHAAGRRQRDASTPPARCSTRAASSPPTCSRPSADDIQVVPGQGPGRGRLAGRDALVGRAGRRRRRPRQRCPRAWTPASRRENDFETPDSSYPFGAHVAVVEVDTETGLAKLVRLVTVDDCGRIANPLLVEGQVHGGIAQGVAQALYEEIAFDEDGNYVTGSLTNYAIPTAAELPSFETARTETPSPLNPLGAKGIGESGTIGSTPAVWNAVVDALAHLGVRQRRLPATPQRVWQAIEAAT